ncbi:MAG TPA: exo-alpha-sialidase [Spirochaetia bacterium]|nr:exo-alpha-sialidase [Spirochaetia bacterium]
MRNSSPFGAPELVRAYRIWDVAHHNAFTDLVRFNGRFYCTFREASGHLNSTGKIRVISSADGREFESTALFAQRGVDLRDPKLSVAPGNRLMLLAGGTRFKGAQYVSRQPRVAFSADGIRWGSLEPVLEEGDWLWRVTWHEGVAYGISYRLRSRNVWVIELFAGNDGISFSRICRLAVNGKPNEATIRFGPKGEAMALVRREGGDRNGWIGTSAHPYVDWRWTTAGHRLGGPNFLLLPNGAAWAAGRQIVGRDARTVVALLTSERYEPVLELPSGGDCSYPGMLLYRGRLWMSYYSSHEGRASIYLAIVRFAGGIS